MQTNKSHTHTQHLRIHCCKFVTTSSWQRTRRTTAATTDRSPTDTAPFHSLCISVCACVRACTTHNGPLFHKRHQQRDTTRGNAHLQLDYNTHVFVWARSRSTQYCSRAHVSKTAHKGSRLARKSPHRTQRNPRDNEHK